MNLLPSHLAHSLSNWMMNWRVVASILIHALLGHREEAHPYHNTNIGQDIVDSDGDPGSLDDDGIVIAVVITSSDGSGLRGGPGGDGLLSGANWPCFRTQGTSIGIFD
jgi:hypothetical protein